MNNWNPSTMGKKSWKIRKSEKELKRLKEISLLGGETMKRKAKKDIV